MTPGSANCTYVAASGDLVLDSGGGTNTITPDGGARVWTIQVASSVATTFLMRINSQNLTRNGGANLVAAELHTFIFIAQPGVAVSFRFGADTTVRYFAVAQTRS